MGDMFNQEIYFRRARKAINVSQMSYQIKWHIMFLETDKEKGGKQRMGPVIMYRV